MNSLRLFVEKSELWICKAQMASAEDNQVGDDADERLRTNSWTR